MENINKKTEETLKIKSWEDLTLADNFIFQKLMRNQEICKKVLSEIIGKEIVRIEYPEYEKTIDVRVDSKGIRLDVYIKGKDEVYNVEIQNSLINYLPKRGRYYQDLIDLDLLEKGQKYNELCHSYVIFICTYDFYQENQYKYTFTYKCNEVDNLEYGDLTTQIVLNTQGTKGNVSNDLKTFLKCINGVFSDEVFSATIKNEFDRIKLNKELRREYMTLELELMEKYDAGEAAGYAKGLAKGHADAKNETINIIIALKSGLSANDVATKLNVSLEDVQQLQDILK